MSQDDLMTPEERASMDEYPTEDTLLKDVPVEPVVADKVAEAIEAVAEPAVEVPAEASVEVSVEAPEVIEEPVVESEVEFIPSTNRYPEVALTDTVPPDLASKLVGVEKSFEDGEIDITAYMNQRSAIERQVTAYQINEANEHKAWNNWMNDQDVFLDSHREYVGNKILYGALDTAVAEVRSDVRSRGMTPAQILSAADYLVKDSLGIKQETPKPKAETKPVVKANTVPVIPTLGSVPSTEMNATGTDPFSAIDRLVGDEREAAVAKLSAAQYEQYLRG